MIRKNESQFKKNTKKDFFAKKNLKLVKFIIILALSAILLFGLFQLSNSLFRINKIFTQVNQAECGDYSTLEKRISSQGTNLLTLNKQSLINNLASNYKCIYQVEVVKKFPDTLSVKLLGRQAVAILVPEASSSPQIDLKLIEATSSSMAASLSFADIDQSDVNKYLVDSKGFIFAEDVAVDGVITILVNGQKVALYKEFDSKKINDIVMVNKRLKEWQINPTMLRIDRFNNLLVKDQNDFKIVFWLNNDLNIQLASLQLILQESKIESKDIEMVDLRFNKPVLTFRKNK